MAALRGGGLFGEQLARRAVWGAAGTQLCNVVLSQPQADDMVDVWLIMGRKLCQAEVAEDAKHAVQYQAV